MPKFNFEPDDLSVGLIVRVRRSPLRDAEWELITEVSETWHNDGQVRPKRFRVGNDPTWYAARSVDKVLYVNHKHVEELRKARAAAQATAAARAAKG